MKDINNNSQENSQGDSVPVSRESSKVAFLDQIYSEIYGNRVTTKKTKWVFLVNQSKLLEDIARGFFISSEVFLNKSKAESYKLNDYLIEDLLNAIKSYKLFESLVNGKLRALFESIPENRTDLMIELKRAIFNAGEGSYEYAAYNKFNSRETILDLKLASFDDLKKNFINCENINVIRGNEEVRYKKKNQKQFFELLDDIVGYQLPNSNNLFGDEAQIIADGKKYEITRDKVLYRLIEKKDSFFDGLKNTLEKIKSNNISFDESILTDLNNIEQSIKEIKPLLKKEKKKLDKNKNFISSNLSNEDVIKNHINNILKKDYPSFVSYQKTISKILFDELLVIILDLYADLSGAANSEFKDFMIGYKSIQTQKDYFKEDSKGRIKSSIINFNIDSKFDINGKKSYEYFIEEFIKNLLQITVGNEAKEFNTFISSYNKESENWYKLSQFIGEQVKNKEKFPHINKVKISILKSFKSMLETIRKSPENDLKIKDIEYQVFLARIKFLEEKNEKNLKRKYFSKPYKTVEEYIADKPLRTKMEGWEKEDEAAERTRVLNPIFRRKNSIDLLFKNKSTNKEEDPDLSVIFDK